MSDDEVPYERNPALRRLARQKKQSPAYWKSKGLEKDVAKRIGGRRTSGSGNKREKGDVRKRGIVRVEHKATSNKSFSVTREMLDKVQNAALLSTEMPVLVVAFLDADGNVEKEVAVLPFEELEWILNSNGDT